jgi:hypothetical protein
MSNFIRGTLTMLGMMTFLTAFLLLNGLHYAGVL